MCGQITCVGWVSNGSGFGAIGRAVVRGVRRPVSSCLEWVVDRGCGSGIACVGGRMCGGVLLMFALMEGLFAAMKWVCKSPLMWLLFRTR